MEQNGPSDLEDDFPKPARALSLSERSRLCCSTRLVFAILVFLGMVNLYMQRTDMSVAVVCMLNRTAVDQVDGDFVWSKGEQGLILGAFFWGYIVTQLPGGVLAERYGGAPVCLAAMLLSAVGTILSPFAAQLHVVALIAARVVVGLGGGAVFPALHAAWSHWAPPLERSMLVPLPDPKTTKGHEKIPWMTFARSMPVWAIVVVHTCANFTTYLVLTQLPTYMNEVLQFDIKANGLISAIPYIAFFVCIQVAGLAADWMRSARVLRTGAVRKLMNVIALVGQGFFLVAAGYCDCTRQVLAVTLITVAQALSGFQFAGFCVNHVDIAPKYAGTLFGISNTFATLSGIVAPYIAGEMTQNGTASEWRVVFWVACAIGIFGAAFFVVFGSGDLQPWAVVPDKSPSLAFDLQHHRGYSTVVTEPEEDKLRIEGLKEVDRAEGTTAKLQHGDSVD